MKALIGMACVAVIALAIYVIGGDIMKSRTQSRQAFAASCDMLLINDGSGDASTLSESEKSRRVRRISECLDFIRLGKMP